MTYPLCVKVGRRMGLSIDSSSDLAQEVLVSMLSEISNANELPSSTYARQLFRWRALDLLRHRHHEELRAELLVAEKGNAEMRFLLGEVIDQIERLPPQQNLVAWLTGTSIDEIAKSLSTGDRLISTSTVRSHIRHARYSLCQWLDEND